VQVSLVRPAWSAGNGLTPLSPWHIKQSSRPSTGYVVLPLVPLLELELAQELVLEPVAVVLELASVPPHHMLQVTAL